MTINKQHIHTFTAQMPQFSQSTVINLPRPVTNRNGITSILC